MDENDDKVKEEDTKKDLYSYSADDNETLNITKIQVNNKTYDKNFRYEYTDEIGDKNNIDTDKRDITFILCIIAGCLNFIFAFLFIALNFKNLSGGISILGRNALFSNFAVDILLMSLVLIFLFIAGFVFLYVYSNLKIVGIFGIIVCAIVCLLCLFIESLTVLVQLVLYTIAIILFFNNYIKERRYSF